MEVILVYLSKYKWIAFVLINGCLKTETANECTSNDCELPFLRFYINLSETERRIPYWDANPVSPNESCFFGNILQSKKSVNIFGRVQLERSTASQHSQYSNLTSF